MRMRSKHGAVLFGSVVGVTVSVVSPYNFTDWQLWAIVIVIISAVGLYLYATEKA